MEQTKSSLMANTRTIRGRSINEEDRGAWEWGQDVTVLLGSFGVVGVMDGVVRNGWERDLVLLGRPFPLPVATAAWMTVEQMERSINQSEERKRTIKKA